MEADIFEAIGRKGADLERIADQAIGNPAAVARLFEGLKAKSARVKYGCEKVLRRVSERSPQQVYPHFDALVELMDGDNSFLKWGAIGTIARLAPVDTDRRIEAIFGRYFAPLRGPVMVTAVSIIGGAAAIASAEPALADRIAKEILQVETACYQMHGAPSPECRNVACGQAIDAFAVLFEHVGDKKPIVEFVRRQLQSTRPAVQKKAAAFLKRYDPAA
jgi:hypothetical protein